MVRPMDSMGWVRIRLTFPPAVMAATAAEPKPLTAVWRTMEPTAVRENCSPMGRPMIRSRRISVPPGRQSSFFMCRMGNRFQI